MNKSNIDEDMPLDNAKDAIVYHMRDVLDSIAKSLLKKDSSIIVVEEQEGKYRWFIETLSLMAKRKW